MIKKRKSSNNITTRQKKSKHKKSFKKIKKKNNTKYKKGGSISWGTTWHHGKVPEMTEVTEMQIAEDAPEILANEDAPEAPTAKRVLSNTTVAVPLLRGTVKLPSDAPDFVRDKVFPVLIIGTSAFLIGIFSMVKASAQ